jgi:hypothetical protein
VDKNILLLLLILVASLVGAQPPKQLPAPPEAVSLGKFIDFPVGLHSGTPHVEIPLYTLKTYDFELPILASYHASGIKVQEVASRLGIGWALKSGGIITRVVNDKPDISYTEAIGGQVPSKQDLEEDIFYYNFGNYSGKFLIKRISSIEYSIVKIDRNDLKIIYQDFSKFVINDIEGNEYTFEPIELTSNYSDYWDILASGAGPTPNWQKLDYVSSWNLTRIKLSNKREVNFKYNRSLTVKVGVTKDQSFVKGSLFPSGSVGSLLMKSKITQTISSRLLTEIKSDNITVKFLYDLERMDLEGDRALTSIEVFNLDNLLIKKLNFNYAFVDAEDCPSGVSPYACKRLFLMSITETNGCESLPPFKFEYNQTKLPHRESHEQDHWGYYNDNNSISWVPKIFVYPQSDRDGEKYLTFPKPGSSTSIILDGADKMVNPSVLQAGVLKKIIHPLGAVTEYEYEPNEFLWFSEASSEIQNGYNLKGGGVRVTTIRIRDNEHIESEKTFNYNFPNYPLKSSGGIVQLPIQAYPGIDANGKLSTQGENKEYYEAILIRYGKDQSGLGIPDDGTVGYRYVTVTEGGNGKALYHYSYPGAYGEANDDPSKGCTPEVQGVCDNLYALHKVDYTAYNMSGDFQNSGVELLSKEPNTMPFLSHTNYEWNRGLLLEQQIYDEEGKRVKFNQYKYELLYANDRLLLGTSKNVCCASTELGQHAIKYASFDLLLNIGKKVKQRIETDFEQNNPKAAKETFFEYDLQTTLPVEIRNSGSNGSDLIQRFIYPFHYNTEEVMAGADQQVDAIVKMKEINKYSNAIEKQLYRNIDGNMELISNELVKYRIHDGIVVPHEIYTLSSDKPVNQYNASSITNSSFVYDHSIFSKAQAFLSYNQFGTPLEMLPINGIIQSYFTGIKRGDNNEEKLTAIAYNAEHVDVSYTSFEDDNTNGWSYPLNGAVNDAKTGMKSFNLNNRTITKVLSNGGDYWLTFWKKKNSQVNVTSSGSILSQSSDVVGSWELEKMLVKFNAANGVISINGSGIIDELRLYPVNSMLHTYSYLPGVGLISEADENSISKHYGYDELNRLSSVYDGSKNLLTYYVSHYKENTQNSGTPNFGFNFTVDKYRNDQLQIDIFHSGYCNDQPFSYLVDFGDGSTTVVGEKYVTHHYAAYGVYNVVVSIRNSHGIVLNNVTKQIVINPKWEEYNLDFSYSINEYINHEYAVQTKAILDPETTLPTSKWDMYIQWTFDGCSVLVGTDASCTYFYPSQGRYDLYFELVDKATGKIIKKSPVKSILLYHETPCSGITSIDFSYDNYCFKPSITFSGNCNYDNITYYVDFGNGESGQSTNIVCYNYPQDGAYTATLTVRDGQTVLGSKSIELQYTTPIDWSIYSLSFLNNTLNAAEGPIDGVLDVRFTASLSNWTGNLSGAKLIWDFGDDTGATTTSWTVYHQYWYSTSGYKVTLKLVDLNGVELKRYERNISPHLR